MTRTSQAGLVDSPRIGWSGAVLAAALLWGCQSPAPPMPAAAPPKAELSYLNIAISMPLAPFEREANDKVPRTTGVTPFRYSMDGGAAPPSCGVDAGYSITRGPLTMSGVGNTLITSTVLSYWLKGRKQIPCPGPATVASCGTDGEPPRTASMSISTAITILPDLTTSAHSTLGPVVPSSRCVLHPVELDVTDGIATAFDDTLKEMLPKLDKRVSAGLNLRKRAQASWARMSEPTELRPGLWLALNPEGIGIVPVTFADGELHTGIQVRLRPEVSAGAKPNVSPKPFPQADVAAPSDTFKLQIPVDVKQTFVQAKLDKALDLDQGGSGMTMSMSGYSVRVTSADVTGQGSQIVIKLTFTGDLTGTAYLNGTPYYDTGTRTLSFPDLDYTLDTSEALLKSASWFAHSEVRDRLRERFKVDMAQPIDQMKQGLEAVLNRSRGNVHLHGTVEELTLLGVYRLPNGDVFTAYLAAHGKISADIDAQ